MKKSKFLIALMLAIPLITTSCNKNGKTESANPNTYNQQVNTPNKNTESNVNYNNNNKDFAKTEVMSDKKMTAESSNEIGNDTYNFVNPIINGDITEVNRKLTRNGSISISVEDLSGMDKSLYDIAQKYSGYIFYSNESAKADYRILDVTIKVDAQHFDKAIEEIKALGTVNSSSFSVDDITLQYVDTEASLKNLRALEERLLELIKKAERIEDLITLERELQNTRSQIESTTSQLNLLKNQVQYSTITVNIMDRKPVTQNPPESFGAKFLRNLREGTLYWISFVLSFINGIAYSWPIIILLLLLLLYLRSRGKKRLEEIKIRNEKIAEKERAIKEKNELEKTEVEKNDQD